MSHLHPVQVALGNSVSALRAFEQDFRAQIAQRVQHDDFNAMRDNIDLGLKIQAAHAEVERIHADISLLLEKSGPIFVQRFVEASEPAPVTTTPVDNEPVSVPAVKEKSEAEAQIDLFEGQTSREKHTRGSFKRMKVTFGDGKVIEEPTSAMTFAKSIQKMGFMNVKKLGLKANKTDLVSTSAYEKCVQEKIGRHYIVTHLNANKKKDYLEEAAKQLGLQIQVEVW